MLCKSNHFRLMKFCILKSIMLLSGLLLQSQLYAQTYILDEELDTIYTCSGTILDRGGDGNYQTGNSALTNWERSTDESVF